MLDNKTIDHIIGLARDYCKANAKLDTDALYKRIGFKHSSEFKKYTKLRNSYVDKLDGYSYETLCEVEALMMYGRGDFHSLEEATEYINKMYVKDDFMHTAKAELVGYLLGIMPLAEYLEMGRNKAKRDKTE